MVLLFYVVLLFLCGLLFKSCTNEKLWTLQAGFQWLSEVAYQVTFSIVFWTKCSVLHMSAKYFFFKRLPWELCVVFNVKRILESGYHKNGDVKLFKYILHILNISRLHKCIVLAHNDIECPLSVAQDLGGILWFYIYICIYL